MKSCLHCTNVVADENEDFCCLGCKEAYHIISQNGFKDYYKLRSVSSLQLNLKPLANQDFNFNDHIIKQSDHFEIEVMVQGLHCGACVWLIENLLKNFNYVISARINLTKKTLLIKWRQELEYGNQLLRLVGDIGYKVMPFDNEIIQHLEKKFDNELFKALAVAGFGAGNIMLFSFALWFDTKNEIQGATRQILHFFSSIIGLPVIIYAGRIFFISAFKALKAKVPSMDIPIAIAIILASLVSFMQTFRGGQNVYFDSAVMLVFFLLIGRYLDFKARKKAFNLATEFSLMQCVYGRVKIADKVLTLKASKLAVGMELLVSAGEKIACDGVVIDGESLIDNSLISGESNLVKIQKNSVVYGGAINIEAPIVVKVTKNIGEGVLSQIIKLINNIEIRKNIYVRIADRLSSFYTPIVHILALLTFALWMVVFKTSWEVALMNATAVLLITCPCALALAVPIVQTLTISNFLKLGIVIKNGEILEKINKIDYVVFDKTGSLTVGLPTLLKVYQLENFTLNEIKFAKDKHIIQLAASIARYSRHPIARSLSDINCKDIANIKILKEHHGQGIEGYYANINVKLGNAEFCGLAIANYSAKIDEIMNRDQANLKCFLKYEHKIYLFTFGDKIKDNAHEVINYLKAHHKKIILLSGDSKNEVTKIANMIDIKEFYWQKNPIEKAQILQNLKDQNFNFMMVGDGLNDAPSLALADVSLSFNQASDISQNIADIVVNSSKLQSIIYLFNYSSKSLKTMRENLYLALLYNLIALPFAIAGFVVPIVAAIAMSSSLFVILNSLKMNSNKIN